DDREDSRDDRLRDIAAARVCDQGADEARDAQHQQVEGAGHQLGYDEGETCDQPDEVGIHGRGCFLRGYATSTAGQGAFRSVAQAGSISACSTSPVEGFWATAAPPRCRGPPPGRGGGPRFSWSLPASRNGSGPIHSRTTKSCCRRLPWFSPAFTSVASRFSYAAR